ncbi:hypothetical protein CROQUDRAFT_479870 [Cronartium quercuum f. sp. fusiforme G11]|uniref:RFX-type winged-helix domain-containing protein n=1 Tax=Cronartium quercuum f. sp. fusiforme G11 TaxID=708437 RepID=A0A9P6TDZ0_9BASI|nr:hypothetical protein CROQUDRAFT_479870 [Cronartium quercuum f. sp. fusiforme G11]
MPDTPIRQSNRIPKRTNARPPVLIPAIPRPTTTAATATNLTNNTTTTTPISYINNLNTHHHHHQQSPLSQLQQQSNSYQPLRLPITTSSARPPSPIRSIQHSRIQPTPPFHKLEAVLGGIPHYLDQPGPQNRILLSIKSGVPDDVDFGLEILLAGSFYEPEAIQLSKFIGLIDALLNLVTTYVSPGLFEDSNVRDVRRRAIEATLIIRNFITLDHFAKLISTNPRLPLTLLNGLELGEESTDPEYLSLLLEILETAATHGIALDRRLNRVRVRPSMTNRPLPVAEQPVAEGVIERPSDWAYDLFSILDTLTTSPDRNLVIGAYRALASLGRLAHNQVILGVLALERCESNHEPWPTSLSRALDLLALPDSDLLLSALDYLYVLTNNPSLALSITAHHPHPYPIAKLLLAHLRHHAQPSVGPAQTLPAPAPHWFYTRPTPPTLPIQTKPMTITPQTPTMTEVHKILLDDITLGNLPNQPEPIRARNWMELVFEPHDESEIAQVTLWLAYKTQFEGKSNQIQMIAPADAIKLTADVFPNAVPSVLETPSGERKFVIKGMRPREKVVTAPVELVKCKWVDCNEGPMRGGSEGLYQHITSTHLTNSEDNNNDKCQWHTCTAKPSDIRTHIITHLLPANTKTDKSPIIIDKASFERFQICRYESVHGDIEDHGAIGIGYISGLVLRNILKSISEQEKSEEEEEPKEEVGLKIVSDGWLERELLNWAVEDKWLSNLVCEMLSYLNLIEQKLKGLSDHHGVNLMEWD